MNTHRPRSHNDQPEILDAPARMTARVTGQPAGRADAARNLAGHALGHGYPADDGPRIRSRAAGAHPCKALALRGAARVFQGKCPYSSAGRATDL